MLPAEQTIPLPARCLTCGYLLQGLPDPVCPECGRAFDPHDPTTFDTTTAESSRRRWIKRGCVALGIVLLVFALFPRRVLTSTMTFTCGQCGETVTVRRWEPRPPRWIPLRYFGVHWTSRTEATRQPEQPPCSTHTYDVNVKLDFYNGGWCTGAWSYVPGKTVTFNDEQATLSTAPRVLKSLMAPSNSGIAVRGGVPTQESGSIPNDTKPAIADRPRVR